MGAGTSPSAGSAEARVVGAEFVVVERRRSTTRAATSPALLSETSSTRSTQRKSRGSSRRSAKRTPQGGPCHVGWGRAPAARHPGRVERHEWGPGNRPTAGSAGEAVATRTLEAAVPVSCWDCSADMNVVGSACSGSSARWDAAAVLEVQVREHAVPVDRGDASGGFSGSRSTRSGRWRLRSGRMGSGPILTRT